MLVMFATFRKCFVLDLLYENYIFVHCIQIYVAYCNVYVLNGSHGLRYWKDAAFYIVHLGCHTLRYIKIVNR